MNELKKQKQIDVNHPGWRSGQKTLDRSANSKAVNDNVKFYFYASNQIY